MSKYKVGDKVILTVTGVPKMGCYYVLNDRYNISEQSIDKYAEPLTTYTEPLERKNENKQKQIEKLVDKLHRQAAEITRLLEENMRLKPNYENIRAKGQNEAWELARKIVGHVRDGGYSAEELEQIFGCAISQPCITENTYSEAAAKVAKWEKAKEEIKVGDVFEFTSGDKAVVMKVYEDGGVTLFFPDGGCGIYKPHESWHKTGRHIDIDGFLKQIGGEKE